MLKMMNVDMNEDHALHLFTVSLHHRGGEIHHEYNAKIFLKCKKKKKKEKRN